MADNLIFKNIRVLIFDVDGVFTDHKILVTDDDQYLRTMSTRDGYAMRRAVAAGLETAIITGGTSKGVESRFRGLGVDTIYSNVQEKGSIFQNLLIEKDWTTDEVLYMGDDIPDIECIEMAGVGACPADAVREVIKVSDFVSSVNGGEDCVRDLIERILSSRGLW